MVQQGSITGSVPFVAIGTSLGGTSALQALLPAFTPDFPGVVTLVFHHGQGSDETLARFLRKHCRLPVEEAHDKTPIRGGRLYYAPADYHLLVEDRHFALSTEAPVSYARPSIDVLFESAAEAYRQNAVGIVLTGAGQDGARGLLEIKRRGGLTIAQMPATAECPSMPKAAIATGAVDLTLTVAEIVPLLLKRRT